MSREVHESAARQLGGVRSDFGETVLGSGCDGIGRSACDRIVKLRPHQRAPGGLEDRPAIPPARLARQRHQRLGQTLQPQLDLSVPPLEWRAGAVHSLQRPGVPVRPPQLARQRFRRRAFGCLEEFVEARNAERARGLEVGQQIAQTRQGRMGRMVIGADKQRNLLARRALYEPGAHLSPDVGQPCSRAGQGGADLVAFGRQMPEQDLPAVGPAPAKEIAVLVGLAAEAAPQDAVLKTEFARDRGKYRGMAERIGRVQHVESSAETFRIRRTEQQVSDQ